MSDQLLIELSRDQAEATAQRQVCSVEAAECETQTRVVQQFKNECQHDLDVVCDWIYFLNVTP